MENTIFNGDALEILKTLPDNLVNCVVTSPPYYAMRDYGIENQIGLEPTFYEYLERLWAIFDEIKRILKDDGTCWVNLGDTYNGNKLGNDDLKNRKANTKTFKKIVQPRIKEKSLCMIPSRFAIGMIERGWILRNEIIWYKPNAMPSSSKDRFTVDFEKIFFFVKNKKYYFEQQLEIAIGYDNRKDCLYKGGAKDISIGKHTRWIDVNGKKMRNKRSVWKINTRPYKDAHFAVFPKEIPEICIKSGCPKNGIVLDPFMGSGTTAMVAEELGMKWIGIEINEKYIDLIKKRLTKVQKRMFDI